MDEQINNRIRTIMEQTEMKPADFCASIGITRSNLAHILSGRNQPSFAMLEKILKAYPQIRAEWLITGMGEMLRDEEDLAATVENLQPAPAYTQFEMQFDEIEDASPALSSLAKSSSEEMPEVETPFEIEVDTPVETEYEPEAYQPNAQEVEPVEQAPLVENSAPAIEQREGNGKAITSPTVRPVMRSKLPLKPKVQHSEPKQTAKKVKKIVYFYDDHSFEEFYPEC